MQDDQLIELVIFIIILNPSGPDQIELQFSDTSAGGNINKLCAAKPEEEDNYGFDIGPRQGAAQDCKEKVVLAEEDQTIAAVQHDPTDIDESIVVDPDAPEEELKKVLMRKYGRHIGGLKAEFNRVRKKGKLPDGARRILKQWFNHHSHWPYPSVSTPPSLVTSH